MSFCSQKRAAAEPTRHGTLSVSPCFGGRAFNLQLERPSKFTGLSARTQHRRALKDAADDSGDGRFHYRLSRLDAMNFQASLAGTPAKATIPRALNCRASCPI
jgi:hypothetical protein